MKRKNNPQELQRRRLKAGRLLLKGTQQAEVARRMGVSRATVCEWKQRVEQGGLAALSNQCADARRGSTLQCESSWPEPCWPGRVRMGTQPSCGPCRALPS